MALTSMLWFAVSSATLAALMVFPTISSSPTTGCTGDNETVCARCSPSKASSDKVQIPDCCKSIDVEQICSQVKRNEDKKGKRSIADSARYELDEQPSYVEDRDETMFDNEEQPESDLEAEKRRSPFLGKRRNPFLGKRRSPFLGKRRNPFIGKRDEDEQLMEKRRMPFLGK